MAFGKLGQTLTAREILDLVQADLEQVEREIGLESVASVDAVTTIGQYLQSGGGKRLRPILVLLCRALVGRRQRRRHPHGRGGGDDPHRDAGARRRDRHRQNPPRPALVNVIWGNHTCVLAGDWLYMQAFQVALRERNFHVLDLLISLTQMMVEGELLQLERIGKIDITEADYMELVDRKTASLFSACARLGAMMRRRRRGHRRHGWASSPGTSASRSSWWTTCWISPRAKRSSASRWATICAKAR